MEKQRSDVHTNWAIFWVVLALISLTLGLMSCNNEDVTPAAKQFDANATVSEWVSVVDPDGCEYWIYQYNRGWNDAVYAMTVVIMVALANVLVNWIIGR